MSKRSYALFEQKQKQIAPKRKKDDPLKILSWNVAGLRKDGHNAIKKLNADIVLLQETKCTEFPPEFARMDEYTYKKLCASKDKNGYAGVAMLSREKPISVEVGLGDDRFDNHARLIQAEFENYYILGVYVLNSGQKLENLGKRKEWEMAIRQKLLKLDALKPVLYVGDMNVAHMEIDLKNPKSNRNRTAGFTDQEREDFTELMKLGFTDVYRTLNPDKAEQYTFWSYMGNARARNVGWRIDYFVVSNRLFDKVIDSQIHPEIMGSDHCPISLAINL